MPAATLPSQAPLYLFAPETGNVAYWELEGSPVYTFTHQGSRAERTYLCAWADRDKFVKGMLGYPWIVNTGIALPKAMSTRVARRPPDYMRDVLEPKTQPNPKPWLYATQISRMEGVEPLGEMGSDGSPAFNWCRVVVLYEGLTYKVKDDGDLLSESPWINESTISGRLNTDPKLPWEWYVERYITRTKKPSVEYLQIGRGKYQYVLEPKPQPFANVTALLQPSVEVVYTWHQVPFLPRAAKLHIGKVNSDYFDPGHESVYGEKPDPDRTVAATQFFGFTPGTLLYSSCEVKPYRLGSGTFVQDVTYRFKYVEQPYKVAGVPVRGRGHNYFLRWNPLTSLLQYVKVTSDGKEDEIGDEFVTPPKAPSTGVPVYAYADFRDLFSQYPRSEG